MTSQPDFIIIDDEILNCVVCKYQIARVYNKSKVETFTDPQKGLCYLKELIKTPLKNKTILFLDINMPDLSGWELMTELEASVHIPNDMLFIYMLSSSIDPIDQEKTKANLNIVDFIAKPLTVEVLQLI